MQHLPFSKKFFHIFFCEMYMAGGNLYLYQSGLCHGVQHFVYQLFHAYSL